MKPPFGPLLLLWTVFGFCAALNFTELSCCDLPLEIPTDCIHDYEISVNKTNLVTVRKCKAIAIAPFKAEGNTVTLEECVKEFVVKIFYNTSSKDDEQTVCYLCKPCDPQTDHNGVVKGVVGGVLVVLVLAGVIYFIVSRLRARGRATGGRPE